MKKVLGYWKVVILLWFMTIVGTSCHLSKTNSFKVSKLERVSKFDTEGLDKSLGAYVVFSKGEGKYAFDEGKEAWYQSSAKMIDYYQPFAEGYIAPWKLVPVGKQDIVTAQLSKDISIEQKAIKFATKEGLTLVSEYDSESKTWRVELESTENNRSYEVFALYEGKTIGKLRVVSYLERSQSITLVPINNAKLDVQQIEQELKAIYEPIGIHLTVKLDESLRGNYTWDLDGDKQLNFAGTSFWGKEQDVKLSKEMKELQKLYKASASYKKDEAYLFVLDKAKSLDNSIDIQGDMPRKSQFGYIFVSNSPNARIIAHEIGHGVFTLQHTFDYEYGGSSSKGKTNNLMDYAEGAHLSAFQWNIAFNKAWLSVLDRAEESLFSRGKTKGVCLQASESQKISEILNTSYKYVLAANGKFFTWPKGAVVRALIYTDSSKDKAPNGSIASFEYKEKLYILDKDGEYKYRKKESFPIDSVNFTIKRKDQFAQITIPKELNKILINGITVIDEAFLSDCNDVVLPDTANYYKNLDFGVEFKLSEHLLGLIGAFVDKAENPKEQIKELLYDLEEQIIKQKTSGQKPINYIGKYLDDRLRTYEKINDGKRFIVVFAESKVIDTNPKHWNSIAKYLFHKTGLTANDILITIPYSFIEGALGNQDAEYLAMPGVAVGKDIKVSWSEFDKDGYIVDDPLTIKRLISDLHKHTTKRYIKYRFYIDFEGTIKEYNPIDCIESGHTYNTEFNLYKNSMYDDFLTLLEQKYADIQFGNFVISSKATESLSTLVSDYKDEHKKDIDTAYLVKHGLNEFYGTSDVNNCRQYALWYRDHNVKIPFKSGIFKSYSPKGNCFIEGKNKTIFNETLNSFDNTGLVLSIVETDWITDLASAIYAGFKGEFSEAGTRLCFAAMPVVTAGAIKKGAKVLDGIESVEKISIKQIERYDAFYKKEFIQNLDDEYINLLRNDIKKGGEKLVEVLSKADKFNSWKLLRSQGRTKLSTNIEVIEQLTRFRTKPKLSKFGITGVDLAKLEGARDISYKQILDHIEVIIENYSFHKDSQFLSVIKELQRGESFSIGAEFTLRYLRDNADILRNKNLFFEMCEVWNEADQMFIRIADIVDKTIDEYPVYYEMKSVINIPPEKFEDQLVKDLMRRNVESLHQLKWVFDGEKLSKNGVNFEKEIHKAIDKLILKDKRINQILMKKFDAQNLDILKNKLKQSDIFKATIK